jgi:opacity protein-like surface antigen
MTWRKGLFLLLLFSFVGVSSARAQHEFEVTPMGGLKFGGSIQLPTGNASGADYLPIRTSANYGAAFDYSIWPNFQAEFQFLHQPTDVDQHFPGVGSSFLTSASVDSFLFGIAYNFKAPDAKMKPFISAGLGFTRWRPTDILPVDSHTFTYTIGGGVKYFITDHIGLRGEIRWIPSRTTTEPAQYCDPFYGFCSTYLAYSHAEQGALNGGIIFRFR